MNYRFVIFSTLDNLELEKYIIDCTVLMYIKKQLKKAIQVENYEK